MLDYDLLKELAKTIKRPTTKLIALTKTNDPFFARAPFRVKAAEWFAREVWPKHGRVGSHLRRIHYRLVTEPIQMPVGRMYENTVENWVYLARASLAARYLDLIPYDGLIDRRNDEPIFNAEKTLLDPNEEREVSCQVQFDEVEIELPEFPTLPET